MHDVPRHSAVSRSIRRDVVVRQPNTLTVRWPRQHNGASTRTRSSWISLREHGTSEHCGARKECDAGTSSRTREQATS